MGSLPLLQMFNALPARYDAMNRILTLGLDQRWRCLAAAACLQNSPRRVLDLACGTGELALRLAALAPDGVEITGVDFSEPMLERARRKAEARGLERRVTFCLADAAELPYPSGYFDAVDIAFAFRNLTHKNPRSEDYLRELVRVLAPGGRCVIVETSQPNNPALRAVVHLYFRGVVAPLGGLLSGRPGAYRYLARSAIHFRHPRGVAELLRKAGLDPVEHRPLLGGVAALHLASKP